MIIIDLKTQFDSSKRILISSILFLLISTAAWAASPVIFYSDLTAGPNTGGQNNYGVFVTIWGNNFGSTQGSSYITVGGGKVNNYPTWTNTMICFQLGPNAATGSIVLVTSNGNATGPAFTVQAGNIYFVQPGAVTNGTGTYASPFNHLYYFESIANPGDTVYVMAGTIYDEVDGHQGWHGMILPERGGTQGSPVGWIAYPNATVILQADGGTAAWTDGSSGGSDSVDYIFRGYTSWHTISKFTMELAGTNGTIAAVGSGGYDGWKIVGNNITGVTYPYDLVDIAGNYSQVLGNEIHNSGSGTFNNEDHSIYWDGGGTNVEIGWNYIHDNNNVGWEISCFHQGSATEPTRVGKIHDNLITNVNGNIVKGILLGDVDGGENEADVEGQNIEVYNNILYNLGYNEWGGAIQAVSGTAYIYNNTIYQSPDSDGTIQFPSGGIGPGGGSPVWYVANNIIYNSISSSLYLSDGSGNAPNFSNFALLTNNNYYGAGNGPSQDPKPVDANPQFVTPGTNFGLQATSPDINAGYNTTAIVADDYSGLVRSVTPSIGAYEVAGSNTVPPVPSTPVVSITSPASGVSLTVGANVTITATASETNGTITNIALYNGATLLGQSSTSPYTFTMTDPAIGIYTLTAKATDANGVSVTSSSVLVTIIALPILPSPPVVAITSPASGSNYTAGSNVTITSTAFETNGTISNIALYNGSGVLLGSSSTSPYNYVNSNMAAGSYTFYAVAKDVNGVTTTSSSITVTVTAPVVTPSAPVVALTSPANGSSFVLGTNEVFTASASETNGSIANVSYYYNGSNLIGSATTSPYSYTLVANTVGTYTITAVATDANGVSVTSSPITVSVIAAPVSTAPVTPSAPVVEITNPAYNSTLTAGSNMTITASASETNGAISTVFFYNGMTLLGSSSSSPYTYNWNNVPAGIYSLTALATDAEGNSTTSSPITVTVTAAPVSTAPGTPSAPVVTLTGPANGSSFALGANEIFTASASETNGSIVNVSYYYNGSNLIGSVTTSPYTYILVANTVGTYTITAVATDANGVSVTSSPVTVTVTNQYFTHRHQWF